MRKKKILIDAKSLIGNNWSGIAKYTYEVSTFLLKLNKLNIKFSYGYPSKKIKSAHQAKMINSLKQILISSKYLQKYSRKLLSIPHLLYPKTYDVYWQPNFILNPYVKAKKKIITLHDFSFLHYPEAHPKERIEYFNKYFERTISKTDYIITGSHFIKNEIIKILNFNPEKIFVIYHGVNHNIYKLYNQDILVQTKNKFLLKENFLLYVGSIEPRKNLQNLLEAFLLLPIEMQQEYPLYLVGCKGWENNQELKKIHESAFIHYLGYVEEYELAHIYNLATIFIYPSLYEGFGLPPIEAMSCGTPVIVSAVASIPEICLDAALYIEPMNLIDIKEKLEKLINNKDLQLELRIKGLNLAKKYTWENSAFKHLKLLLNV